MIETAVGWIATVVMSDNIVLMLVMFGGVGLLEWMRPARQIPRAHYKFNFVYSIVTMLLATALTPLIATTVALAVRKTGIGLFDLRQLQFDGITGAVFALAIATLIYDFFFYWMHRLQHKSVVLWQEHLLHHSDEFMNVTTSSRSHVFDIFLTPVFIAIPMALLFDLPAVTIGWMTLIPTAWNYFTHANIRLGFGRLWWLFVSPDYHRIHHSQELQHQDMNFAEYFPVWDIVFGTVWRPRPGECPTTGVTGIRVRTLREAYMLPIVGWLGLVFPRLGHTVLPPLRQRP